MNITSPITEIILRGNDPTGHGYYGAKRGTRKHNGIDLVAEPGTIVKAPINGFITKYGYPYNHTQKLRYIEITGDVYRVWLMYAELKETDKIKIGHRVFKGDIVGEVQNVSGYWKSKMLNHLHFQVWKHGLLTDPEPLIINYFEQIIT